MAGLMKRRTRQIATVVALIGLQAPICALACMQSPTLGLAAVGSAMPPCHERGSESSPSQAPRSDRDCCAFAGEAAVFDASVPVLIASVAVTSRSAFWWPVAHAAVAHVDIIAASLPPPDILLLKSTLII